MATIIGLASYIPYLRGTLQGKFKPSVASWLVWGILTGIACAGQLVAGGGIGALTTGTSAVASFLVMGLALRDKSSRTFSRLDWGCLAASILAIGLWPIADDPFISVLLVSVITFVGYIPTYLKSYDRPHEENISMYLIGIIKFLLAAITLSHYSPVTLLYPAVVIGANTALITLLTARRKRMTNNVPALAYQTVPID